MLLHPVTVDSREQMPSPQTTVDALAALGVPAVVGTLPAGDFRWICEPEDGGQWWCTVVERKSLKDLVASVDDGRLARFVDETGGADPPPSQIRALLVEGDVEGGLDVFHGRSWSPEALESLLVDVQMLGIVIVRSPSSRSTPKRLANFWRWTGKDSHKALLKPTLPGISDDYINPEKKAAVRSLMVLPGWGESRARAVIAAVGSPANAYRGLLDRHYEMFKDIPGIGKGLVNGAAAFLEKTV